MRRAGGGRAPQGPARLVPRHDPPRRRGGRRGLALPPLGALRAQQESEGAQADPLEPGERRLMHLSPSPSPSPESEAGSDVFRLL